MAPEFVNQGFDRLQRLLLDMHTGDELRATEASERTGLSPEMCRAVLEGLTRAGLMSREPDDRFVRRTLDLAGT
jgi:DNA-binding IclR family transcriptional regulator